jgi:hypothetical protein
MKRAQSKKLNMKKLLIIFLAYCLWIPCLADTGGMASCRDYPFLKQGFNINHYQQCQKLIQKCPSNGIVADESCVKKISQANSVCKQFNQLAEVVEMPITSITAKKLTNFTVIDKSFSADGQDQYYLISPAGCMLDTQIDPRKLDLVLANQYKNVEFIFVNTKEPQYKVGADNSHNFLLSFEIAKNCLACERIGHFAINFNFDQAGNLHEVSLSKEN